MVNKYLVLFVGILLLAACSNDKKPPVDNTPGAKTGGPKTIAAKPYYANPLLIRYKTYIDSLDSGGLGVAGKAAEKYSTLFSGKNDNTCDSAFLIFSRYYDKLTLKLDSAYRQSKNGLDTFSTGGNQHKNLSPKSAGYQAMLQNNGFNIVVQKADTYIGQDGDFVAKRFYKYLSPLMKEYLQHVDKERKDPCVKDLKLVVSARELVDRAIWWERFVKDNPRFISLDKAVIMQKSYLQLLLQGTDFTYVVADNNHLTEYFGDAYKYLTNKYSGTSASEIVKPYYNLLLNGQKLQADRLMNTYYQGGVTG